MSQSKLHHSSSFIQRQSKWNTDRGMLRFANTTGRLFSLSAMFPWRAFPCSLVLVVIDVLAAGLSYFVPFIRVLTILFGIAWVAYAKSLILLWGFKRYGGTGKVENPQYVNAHE